MKWSRHCCRCCSDQSNLLTPVLLSDASWFLFSDDAITRILPVTHQARVHAQRVRWVDGFRSRMIRVARSARPLAHFLARHVVQTGQLTDEGTLELAPRTARFALVVDEHFGHVAVQ